MLRTEGEGSGHFVARPDSLSPAPSLARGTVAGGWEVETLRCAQSDGEEISTRHVQHSTLNEEAQPRGLRLKRGGGSGGGYLVVRRDWKRV